MFKSADFILVNADFNSILTQKSRFQDNNNSNEIAYDAVAACVYVYKCMCTTQIEYKISLKLL